MEKILEFKGHNVIYNATDERSDAILFLHPSFADSTVFEEQVSFFKENYQVITIDFFGHGKNAKSPLTFLDQVDVCYEVLKQENIYKAHLVGVSLGSLVAQGIADKYPQLVDSVTVVGGYSIHKDNEFIIKAQKKEITKWIFKMIFSMPKFRDYVTSVSVYTNEGKQKFREATNAYTRASFSKMRGSDSFFRNTDIPVSYPLLALVGEYDIETAKQAAELFALDGHEKIEVKGAGHCINLDKPQLFNDLILEFISKYKGV